MPDDGGLGQGIAVSPALVFALVLTSVAAVGGEPRPDPRGAWTAPAARCETLAEGLRIAPVLRPVVVDMCRRAPTFRRQVARIARQSGLEVTMVAASSADGPRASAHGDDPGGRPAAHRERRRAGR